jgi:hypothetical protein
MRIPVIFVAATSAFAAAALVAPAASAQISPSMSGSSSLQYMDDGEAWRTIVGFGSCFARRYPNDVVALLAVDPGSAEENELFSRVISRRAAVCLSGGDRVRMPRWIIRGAVLEGLYRSRGEVPVNLMVSAPPAAGTATSLSGAAFCYAALHPQQVRTLLEDTRAGSRDEYESLSTMAEAFFGCFDKSAGAQNLPATAIRYRLVEAALRLPRTATSAAPRQ